MSTETDTVDRLREQLITYVTTPRHPWDSAGTVEMFEAAIRADERRQGWGSQVAQDDLRAILHALGLGTHARPSSPHEVIQGEVIPELRRMMTRITGGAS